MSCLNVNEITLAGRIETDIELKTTSNGTVVTSFSVAVNRNTSGDGEQVVDFIPVVAWKQRAEFLANYFRKGSAVYIKGTLNMRKWTDNDGKSHNAYEVNALSVKFIDSKKDLGESGEAQKTMTSAKPSNVPSPAAPASVECPVQDTDDDYLF